MSCFLLAGFGCQSTLDIAGGEHKTVSEKWRALSNYAESNIGNYGITITARLAIGEDENFKLTHFKITNKPSRQDIDLLTPNFENKYICSPTCYQLIEYFNFSGQDGTTLLTNYFDRHEFELFKFYGDIQLLNNQLVKLANHDQRLLQSYLTSLAHQSTSFERAKEFTQFLNTILTLAALDNFADNPEEIFSHFLKNYQITNENQWKKVNTEQDGWTGENTEQNEWTGENTEQDGWTGSNTEQDGWTVSNTEQDGWTGSNTEQDHWTASTETPEVAWSSETTISPETIWLKELPEQTHSTDNIVLASNQPPDNPLLSWQSARAYPIKVGDNVCSYQESLFGIVAEISVNQVIVNLLGQAKRINEGIVYPAEQGDLFAINENVYFSPLTKKKSFEKHEIARCSLE
jgi:hypothetical protein